MDLIPFEASHLQAFEPGLIERQFMADHDVNPDLWAGKALSLVEEDTVLGIGGVYDVGNQVGVPWILFSDELRKRPVLMHKLALGGLDEVLRMQEFRSVLTAVHHTYESGHRWVQRLGFVRLCEMGDYVVYERTS